MILPKIYGLSMALPQKIRIFPQLPPENVLGGDLLQHAIKRRHGGDLPTVDICGHLWTSASCGTEWITLWSIC